LRILIISNIRQNKSGITVQVLNLSQRLIEESYNVVLVSTYGSIFNRVKGLIQSFKNAFDSDIILGVGCAFYGFFPIAVASSIAYLTGKPVFFNFHDGQAQVFLEKSEKLIKFFIRDRKVIVASEYINDIFRKYSFNTELINNIFDYSSFPKREGEFKWNKKIIWARSFEKIYQPEFALNVALKTLENVDCEFHFYGNGSLYDDLYKKYKHPSIIFHNVVLREHLLKDLSNASIFLNTTIYDNMPNIFFESGYYKLLIVSTKVGGISTTFNENEVVYSPEIKVEAFSGLLNKIINNPSEYDFYRENLNKKILMFTWENVSNKWISLIDSILK
jgi:glycosyltransferase involved in cell wall biosynthesis